MEQPRKIVPPVWLLLCLLAMGLLDNFLPLAEWLAPPWSYLGFGLILAGLWLALAGVAKFMQAGTPIIPFERPTALVTGGLYRHTRNPMYLGMVLLLLGIAVVLGSLSALLPIPAFIWIITRQFIEGEERFLTEIFGDDYLSYKARVRRWL